MFATLKQITAPTNKDLRKRIYFTLGALLIFIVGPIEVWSILTLLKSKLSIILIVFFLKFLLFSRLSFFSWV